jgi:hypothetical protein
MASIWIKHEAKAVMPVDADTIVDIKWADGVTTYGEVAGHYDWTKSRGKKMVIIAYMK